MGKNDLALGPWPARAALAAPHRWGTLPYCWTEHCLSLPCRLTDLLEALC